MLSKTTLILGPKNLENCQMSRFLFLYQCLYQKIRTNIKNILSQGSDEYNRLFMDTLDVLVPQ